MPEKFNNSEKLSLVEYLLNEVMQGISGRDRTDLPERPYRILFAGVLGPRINSRRSGDGTIPTAADLSENALGVDCKARLSSDTESLKIRVTPSFSVYYAVLPTFQVARGSNARVVQVAEERIEDMLLDADEGLESEEISDEEADDDSNLKPGVVTIHPSYRRFDVKCQPIEITVNELGFNQSHALDEALALAVADARHAIENDPDLWPIPTDGAEESTLELGPANYLSSDATYKARIAELAAVKSVLPSWSATCALRLSAPDARTRQLQVLLSNATVDDIGAGHRSVHELAFFDAAIEVDLLNAELVPFEFLLAPRDYRMDREMAARGINCVAVVGEERMAKIRSETLPIFRQPLYRTREASEIPFSRLVSEDFERSLRVIANDMRAFLGSWDTYITNVAKATLAPDEFKECAQDRDNFRAEVEQFELGLECLVNSPALSQSFRLMNKAFLGLASESESKITGWRLFQIGFIVSQLPSIACREVSLENKSEMAGRLRANLDTVDILWFPTGGGKTEAYLGLIATAMIFDRLRGKDRGICAWMRFPLRMLSLQQLERLARVVASLNRLRESDRAIEHGDPFSIGYFVGGDGSPNSLSRADADDYERHSDRRESVRLLRNCPFCGSHLEIKVLRSSWRLAHTCPNENCFSNVSASLGRFRGSVPVFIVDTEIYRYLPSVLVGTIDKLAAIGREPYFAHLVRGAGQECPEHGYTSYDQCIEHWNGCKKTKRELRKLPAIKDPGISLLIQDEFHLLRDELGVFAGHYEGLLSYLGSRAHMRPKVLAATATIEAYDTQAFNIYLSKARRFPQPGWELGESFYATSTPLEHRRLYVGLLNHTRAIEDPSLRLIALYIRAIRRLRSRPEKIAEIIGRANLSLQDAEELLRLYDLTLAYVGKKATGGAIQDKKRFIEQTLEHEQLGMVTSQLLTGDQTIEEVGSTIERVEKEKNDTGSLRLDMIVATNLISHGVDLERINMMAVCGTPSHYAEYVQSTSRCARTHPGIVFVCFRGRDPREASQFQFFDVMNRHMDRLIEAVGVNRFSSFAPQKTVPGLLAGLLLCRFTPDLFGSRINRPLDYIPTLKVALGYAPATSSQTASGCVSRDELETAIDEIVGVDNVKPPALPSQIQNVKEMVAQTLDDRLADIGRTYENQLKAVLNPITSFRDIDAGIDFGSLDSSDLVLRLRNR